MCYYMFVSIAPISIRTKQNYHKNNLENNEGQILFKANLS